MDRRDSMKSLLVGTLAGGLVLKGCSSQIGEPEEVAESIEKYYGRTPEEITIDNKVLEGEFLTAHESETISTLCNLILPANENHGSAVDAGVPDFIAFMAKDIPAHQLPLRGGLMWLDGSANRKFNKLFKDSTEAQQKEILDEIAYPASNAESENAGIKFFSLMRDLTLTGYYTSKMGIEELGYKGNQPNVWDGVPDEILADHDVSYDQEWLKKCLNVDTRNETAQWDEDGNLIS